LTAKGKVKRPETGWPFIKTITLSYLLATGLLAALAVGSYTVLHELTNAEATSAAQVNVSGRQRMLSQRIAMMGNRLIEFSEHSSQPDLTEMARRGILDATLLMEQSHQGLIQGDPSINLPTNPSAEVHALYFDGPKSLDMQVRQYVAEARALARAPMAELTHTNAHIRYINAAAVGDLLNSLDAVVRQYQKESEADIAGLQRLQRAIMGLTLAVLLLLVLFIFRPMIRRIRQETGALKSAETRLRAIIENAPDGIITIDEGSAIRSFNPAAEKMFGFKAAEAIGHNVNMLMPEPYHNEHDTYIQRYLQTGQAKAIGCKRDITAKRRDGTVFPMEIVLSEMRIEGERLFIGMLSDITERKQAEEKLECNYNLLQEAETATLNMMLDVNGARERAETAEQELIGHKKELFQLAEVAQKLNCIRSYQEICDTVCQEAMNVFQLKACWVSRLDEGGDKQKPIAFAGSARSFLAAIHEAQKALPGDRQRDGMVIESLDPLVENDIEHSKRYELWRNKAMENHYCSSLGNVLISARDKVYGTINLYSGTPYFFTETRIRMVLTLTHQTATCLENAELMEGLEERVRQRTAELEYVAGELREMAMFPEMSPAPVLRVDRDGTVCVANQAAKQCCKGQEILGTSIFSLCPGLKQVDFEALFNVNRKPLQIESNLGVTSYLITLLGDVEHDHVYVYAADITQLKQLEAQIRQSQKMEAVGLLAGGIAHDFNSLLGVILGYGDMMRDDIPAGSPLHGNLEEMIIAAERSRDLVRHLMDFGRPSEEEPTQVELTPFLEREIRLLRSSLPATIRIATNIKTKSATVLANPSQIRQVFMNLGINAGRAIGDRHGVLKIDMTETMVNSELAKLKEVEPGAYLQLTVSDTGHGMDKETMEHIFEPFFTSKSASESAGLGLAIVHSNVKRHGGFVTVESEPGKGSSFHVYLPRIESGK